jgi:serine/threonine protein kinase/tetratricopeptide (TPR) repeat protein
MRLQAGDALGPYIVRGPIGAGGMGEVYRASDSRLGRDVAIKVLSTEPDPDRLFRFEQEARATAMLAHPNIVTIFDIGTHQGSPFIVSELLEGETLRARLDHGRLDAESAIALGVQLSRAVAAAHSLRIVHRDLKPENLFLTRTGVLKVLDFGLAKLKPEMWHGNELSTIATSEPGTLLGTPAYMAPEQLTADPVDERADIFAVGTILYEALTGTHPFRRATPAGTLAAILRETPARLGRSAAAVPPSGEQLLMRCLEKDPTARFQTAGDLAFALELLSGDLHRSRTGASEQGSVDQSLSIAVLPFADMSPSRDQDYLCEGIAEELINALTHVAGLRVAARSASFQFRSSAGDLRAIGARLGVTAVLDGSVRKAGERLRVIVRLVDVGDGFQRWSERYDKRLEDVFAIQDEIAENVAMALRGILSPHEKEALHRTETSVECYEYFLRARRLLSQFDRAALVTARGLLDRAIEIDPNYAPAHAALGEIHAWMYEWWGGSEDDYRAADRETLSALALAPRLAEAHAARGFVLALSRRYDEAAVEFETAIGLNPNLFEASYLYARSCFAAGQIERSAELFFRAGDIRHEDFQSLMLAAQSLLMLGRNEEAERANREGIQRAERHLDLAPGDARALSLGGGALFRDGQLDQALRWSARALELHPDDQGVLINAACLQARAGMKTEALTLLERTFAKGYGKRDWIERDPDYDNLRDDPRFQAMLAKLR